MIAFTYLKGKLNTSQSDADSLFSKGFGEKVGSVIEFSVFDILFLLERNKCEVFFKKKRLSFVDFFKKSKVLHVEYVVYANLRDKGYLIKSGLKYGTAFRVYDKGAKIGDEHASWLVEPVTSTLKTSYKQLAGMNRVAHSTHKKLLFAIVDAESQVTYLEMHWVRML